MREGNGKKSYGRGEKGREKGEGRKGKGERHPCTPFTITLSLCRNSVEI